MFSLPMDQITYERVQDFCSQGIEEGVRLDYKADFPKDLAKLLAAFANTFGGMILIGVEEERRKPKLPIIGIPLTRGLEEQVASIGLMGVYPPVFPEVKVCSFSNCEGQQPDRAVVVIRVHQSDQAPHAIENKTKVYLRVDSQSELFELATIDQIEWLQQRRRAPARLRRLLERKMEGHANAFRASVSSGAHAGAASFVDTLRASPVFPGTVGGVLAKVGDLRAMQCISPPFSTGAAYTRRLVDGGIANYAGAACSARYCEVNEYGLVLLQTTTTNPNIFWEPTAQCIDAFLVYVLRVYEQMRFFGLVDLELRLTGLAQRTLAGSPRYGSLDQGLVVSYRGTVDQIRETKLEVIGHMLNRVAWAFNLDEFSPCAVKQLLS